MNEDGSMSRLPELEVMAAKHDLRIISIEQLIRYRMERDRLVHELQSYRLESPYGPWEVRIYGQSTSDQRHASFSFGSWHEQDDVLVRMQSGAFGTSPWQHFEASEGSNSLHFEASMKKLPSVDRVASSASTSADLPLTGRNGTPRRHRRRCDPWAKTLWTMELEHKFSTAWAFEGLCFSRRILCDALELKATACK
jgi:hypothetical protein